MAGSKERSTNKCDNNQIVVKEQASPVSKSLEHAKGHYRSRNRYERIRHDVEPLPRVADGHMANGRSDIKGHCMWHVVRTLYHRF